MKTTERTLRTVVTLAITIGCLLVVTNAHGHGGCHNRRSSCHGHRRLDFENLHRRLWRDFDVVGFWNEPYLSEFNGMTYPSLFDAWHDELLPRRRCLDNRHTNENREHGRNEERPTVGFSVEDEEEARRRELLRESEQRRREEELEREFEAQRQEQMERELREREQEIRRYREAERRRQEEMERQRLRHEQRLETERQREREMHRLREWERQQEEKELERQKEMERERQRLRELEQQQLQKEIERQEQLTIERKRHHSDKLRRTEKHLQGEGSPQKQNSRTEDGYNKNRLRQLPSIELAKLQIEGYYPEDLKVFIQNNKLKVLGKQRCTCDKSCTGMQREFERVYKLPVGTQAETLTASLDASGLLVIRSDYDRFDTSKTLPESVANVQGLGLPYSNPSKTNTFLERDGSLCPLDEAPDDREVMIEVED